MHTQKKEWSSLAGLVFHSRIGISKATEAGINPVSMASFSKYPPTAPGHLPCPPTSAQDTLATLAVSHHTCTKA